MQRLCSKYRSFSQIFIITSARTSQISPSFSHFYNTTSNFQLSSPFSTISSQFKSHFNSSTTSLALPRDGFSSSPLGFPFLWASYVSFVGASYVVRKIVNYYMYVGFGGEKYVQMRYFSAKSKEKKWKKLTPATSKVKKIKMKTISAFKGRFRTLNDGTIRRWREGKRHNAHLKSKKSKRRLRKPEIVPLAYAKVMKKLNFCANY